LRNCCGNQPNPVRVQCDPIPVAEVEGIKIHYLVLPSRKLPSYCSLLS
jgi:hypothetical protein